MAWRSFAEARKVVCWSWRKTCGRSTSPSYAPSSSTRSVPITSRLRRDASIRVSRSSRVRRSASNSRAKAIASHSPASSGSSPTSSGRRIAHQFKKIGSGGSQQEIREKLLEAAHRREIDVVLVWRRHRWGRSVTDLLATLQELEHQGVDFVSVTEASDFTTLPVE